MRSKLGRERQEGQTNKCSHREEEMGLCLSVDREEQEVGPLGRRPLRDNNPKLLLKLLSHCFAKFHSVVQAHTVLLSHLHRAKKVYNGECTHILQSTATCLSSLLYAPIRLCSKKLC